MRGLEITLKIIVLFNFLSVISGSESGEACDLTKVHNCYSNLNMSLLSENQTAFCNEELRRLGQCLEPYDTVCQNDSIYRLNVQAFQPSTFQCQGSDGLQCDVKAIRSCVINLDTSSIVSNVTLFCNFKLKKALDCITVYRDVCSSSSYSDLYSSYVSSLQPEKYGCSGTNGEQCELVTATQCILKFNIQRMEHFNDTGSLMNETALCQHLKSAEACVAPYESACAAKTSFSSIMKFLKDDRCKEPVIIPTNSSPRLNFGINMMALLIINLCLISLRNRQRI
ncbi:uncharacterized protein LOC133172946 [Saccostrea echinata]|uniref:uncharacterized protein LOC133172946 n=1 Tax=Saccostrea echinata TaxID=191078 RepID=UPI002A829AD1|nr:uncharacterized protein LOC133172946 [Saccostrea echinata]